MHGNLYVAKVVYRFSVHEAGGQRYWPEPIGLDGEEKSMSTESQEPPTSPPADRPPIPPADRPPIRFGSLPSWVQKLESWVRRRRWIRHSFTVVFGGFATFLISTIFIVPIWSWVSGP